MSSVCVSAMAPSPDCQFLLHSTTPQVRVRGFIDNKQSAALMTCEVYVKFKEGKAKSGISGLSVWPVDILKSMKLLLGGS